MFPVPHGAMTDLRVAIQHPDNNQKTIRLWFRKGPGIGYTWLAQWVEHAVLGLRWLSLSLMLAVAFTVKIKGGGHALNLMSKEKNNSG